MWRAADISKYGTSHISDVPLDLVNNSISGLTSEKFCRITNLRIFGPTRPPPAAQLHLPWIIILTQLASPSQILIKHRVAGVGRLSASVTESLDAFGERVLANFRDKNIKFA